VCAKISSPLHKTLVAADDRASRTDLRPLLDRKPIEEDPEFPLSSVRRPYRYVTKRSTKIQIIRSPLSLLGHSRGDDGTHQIYRPAAPRDLLSTWPVAPHLQGEKLGTRWLPLARSVEFSGNSDLNLFEQCVVAESFDREVDLSTPSVEAEAQLVSQPPAPGGPYWR
jgi:hypothetical protein